MEAYCFGTGGLVRAYSEALTSAIEKAHIIQKDLGYIAYFKVGYSEVEKIKYFLGQKNIRIIGTEFDENVTITVEIQKGAYHEILRQKDELKFKILETKVEKEGYIEV